ncbi:MAG: hypothetical protein RJQ09_09210 [Cyclobacteriaceae bacterium]
MAVFLSLLLIWYHAIYISVTEMSQADVNEGLAIKMKIFTDDLEDGIYNLSKKSVNLSQEPGKHLSEIENYLQSKFELKLNDEKQLPKVTSAENTGDATWIDLEVPFENPIRSIDIDHGLLTELFDSQSNVVTVDILGEKRFLRLSKSNKKATLNF